MSDPSSSSLEYVALAESLKERGNAAMAAGDSRAAIEFYDQAIALDPDNHIYFSNRSAAHMKADSISKALRDAERCVALAPTWPKSYSRLGAAQHALGRLDAAIASFQKGIELEPSNKSLWAALRSAREEQEAAQSREALAGDVARAAEEARLARRDEALRQQTQPQPQLPQNNVDSNTSDHKGGRGAVSTGEDDALQTFLSSLSSSGPESTNTVAPAEPVTAGTGEDELISSFFDEVAKPARAESSSTSSASGGSEKQEGVEAKVRDETSITEKYTTQELGDSASQLARLTGPNHVWRNLNPYEVLQLDTDATLEDIKYRYRKLSARVHPDKLRDAPFAREAFEAVKAAYQRLLDPQQRDVVVMNIEHIRDETRRERQRLLNKGVSEVSLPSLEEETRKRTMKHFADMELQRRKSEKNLHAHNARERMKEEEEKEKATKQETFDKEWAESERREKRVGNWREFNGVSSVQPETGPRVSGMASGQFTTSAAATATAAAKRPRLATAQREERAAAVGSAPKFGQVELEAWKKTWK